MQLLLLFSLKKMNVSLRCLLLLAKVCLGVFISPLFHFPDRLLTLPVLIPEKERKLALKFLF